MEQMEQQKVETPRSRNQDINADIDLDADLAIYPRPHRSAGPRKLLSSRGRIVLKWSFCLFVIVLLIYLMPRDRQTQYVKPMNESVILLWNEETPVRGWNHYQCPCIVTGIQNYATLPIDAVIVNADRPYSLLGLEKIRHTANFLLVFAAKNPLSLAQNPLMQYSEFYFNFTMTYRLDSDLHWSDYYFSTRLKLHQPVKEFVQPDRNFMTNMTDHLASKIRNRLKLKHLLAVYMSYEVNEYTESQGIYLEELRKHMELNMIKNCHELNECLPYKFMLIFEPSSCPDFVHSQVYMALTNFVVPVVISNGDISQLLPPGSYISGNDFLIPERLAQYLIKIGSQSHLYEQFFWWHSKYLLHQIRQPYCSLCKELKKPRRERKPEEFQKWWTQYKCPPPSERLTWNF
ncbi:alpha-(1,3)-fucosyltransferase C-like [Drosophila innubila]|uniref:alpha-(1,3)-fucosyltransferase C-like n=1 Tax=Drosophila innubila TaxID=198719 RepID=UPI00148D0635|nr:alpha-(1,3)-fucosyltransferase C-like [Drosophila innubila]